MAQDEDAYMAHEHVELPYAKSKKEALVTARTEAVNTLHEWMTGIAIYEISSED